MPAALPLWVLAYSLGIWGFAGLAVRWSVARWGLAAAVLGLGLSCLVGRGKGKGVLLLICAFFLGGLAQGRRAPVLEIPALAAGGLTGRGERADGPDGGGSNDRPIDFQGRQSPEAPATLLAELLTSAELGPERKWLCEGRVIAAPIATEQGVALQVEITALRRADALPEAPWQQVLPPLPIAVSVRQAPLEVLLPGMPVRLCAALRSPRAGQNPGAPDRVRHAAAIGIAAIGSVESEALFPWHGPMAEAPSPAWPQRAYRQLARWAAQLRARLLAQLAAVRPVAGTAVGSEPIAVRSGRAVVAGLALGERGPLIQIDRERQAKRLGTIEDGFRRAGIYHVLSVSGLHLAVVAWIFYRLLAWLLLWAPGAGRWTAHRRAALWAVPPTLFYAVLTGAELATQRAALAAVLGLLAIRCGRRAALSQALAGAVLAIAFPGTGGPGTPALLLCEPALLLSLAATVAIAYLRPLGGLPQRLAPQPARGDGALARLRTVVTGVRRELRAGSRHDLWRGLGRELWRGLGRELWRDAVSRIGRGIGRGIWRLVEGALAAMLATAPICAAGFSAIQLAGVAGNLVPGLLGEMVVLPLAIFGSLVGLGWPAAGQRLLAAAVVAAQAMIRSAWAIAQLAGELWVPAPHPLLALLFWLGLGLGATGRRLGYCGCGLAIAIYLLMWKLPSHELRVTVLDVGQGDAIVVELPAGGVMVIDAGLATAAGVDMGAHVVVPFLRRRGYRRIDIAVASHPHPDHTGGLAALMDSFPIGELWAVPPADAGPRRKSDNELLASRRPGDRDGAQEEEQGGDRAAERGGEQGEERGGDRAAERGSDRTAERGSDRTAERGSDWADERADGRDAELQRAEPSWLRLLQLARQRGIAIRTPQAQVRQGVTIEVLAPCPSREDGAGPSCPLAARPDWRPNDNSLVLRLGYAGRTILLPGDIERAGELALLGRLDRAADLPQPGRAALHADVLKAPHHCSKTSSSEPLVAAVRPQWVVCSLGAYNRYRFPHAAVLARYAAIGSRVLRTDADGAVEFRITAGGELRARTWAIPPCP